VSPLALGAVSSIDKVTTWIINEHRASGVMHQSNQCFNIPPQAFEFPPPQKFLPKSWYHRPKSCSNASS